MKSVQSIPSKIYDLPQLLQEVKRWRVKNKKVVFTNGVFDILHEGHIASLSQAATHGDVLVIGLNSDASVKRLKGDSRPVNNQGARALILASLVMTDAVVIFDEDTPLNLIKAIMPEVLVKGGDYTVEQIAGAKEVIANGGQVILADMVEGISTTAIIEKMKTQ
ncbi:MAG: D-glycero-beta-D-manno-heptose 1-phosphate adenylyltransferase [Bacteroidetes bacterium]|nr:D-glycero-beta-D-manno-heptose 1-phosphate adenylyltransferase [Bacteroidota bacterium]